MLPFFSNSASLAVTPYKFKPFPPRILPPLACLLLPHLHPPLMHTTTMPAPVIKNATTIWDIGVNWPLSSQCGTWDAKGRGVDVWECILARMSPASSSDAG